MPPFEQPDPGMEAPEAMGMAPPDTMPEAPVDPSMMGGPPQPDAGNPFPSTDPAVLAQILQLLGQLRSADQEKLHQEQDAVLMQLLQAMGIGGQQDAGFAEGPVPMNEDPNALPPGP